MCGGKYQTLPKWYRYVVLMAASLSQLLTLGYMTGMIVLMPIHHEDRFNERKISASIGSIQLSLSLLAGMLK